MALFDTARFEVMVGTVDGDKDPQYLVKSKKTGVVEFCNTSFYFVRDWAMQMTKALDEQDEEIAGKKPGAKGGTVVQFPGGGGDGRTN